MKGDRNNGALQPSIVACDFFTVDTALLRRYLQTRRVHLAGATTNPDGRWVAQQARNFSLTAALNDTRCLNGDRDSKFTGGFDEVLRTGGIAVIQTPSRSPQGVRARTPAGLLA
jgi:putative transposase